MAETWIDTRSGELLIGAEAAADRIDEAGPDVVLLAELLTAKEFPFKNGDFGSFRMKGWSPEELKEVGRWTLNVLSSQEGADNVRSISREHIDRLYVLRLCPSYGIIRHNFSNLKQYCEELGGEVAKEVGKYDAWTIADFVAHASKLARSRKRRPTRKDYLKANGPSPTQIKRLTGEGINLLHELIGYPNAREMDEEDYIDWGVKVMEANGGQLSTYIVEVLSARDQGPGVKTIARSFTSFAQFRTQARTCYEVRQEERAAARAEKLAEYQRLQDEWVLPNEVTELSDDAAVVFVAKYWVTAKCLSEVRTEKQIDIAADIRSFEGALRRAYPEVSRADIENAALRLHVFDDIWPMDQYQRHLHVTEQELESVRARDRAQKRRERARRDKRTSA